MLLAAVLTVYLVTWRENIKLPSDLMFAFSQNLAPKPVGPFLGISAEMLAKWYNHVSPDSLKAKETILAGPSRIPFQINLHWPHTSRVRVIYLYILRSTERNWKSGQFTEHDFIDLCAFTLLFKKRKCKDSVSTFLSGILIGYWSRTVKANSRCSVLINTV